MYNSCRGWSDLLVLFSVCQCQLTLCKLKTTHVLEAHFPSPVGLGYSLRADPNLILHPTRSVAQPAGSQQVLATRLTLRVAGCLHYSLQWTCLTTIHRHPISNQTSPLPVLQSFELLLALCHTLALHLEHSSILLSPSRVSPLRSFSQSPWNLHGLFFCYRSLGSNFQKAWGATYFSVIICLLSVFPTQFHEGRTVSALSTSASHCLACGLPAWGLSVDSKSTRYTILNLFSLSVKGFKV